MCDWTKLLLVSALIALGTSEAMRRGYGPGQQDWGWMKVRDGAHMFYWLYYTTAMVTSPYDRPLVIWLQGGPGASSTGYGNFAEIGPLHVNGSARKHAWTKRVNVLFIDNPVGAGFSYVEDVNRLTRDNVQIGRDMVEFLTQFYARYSGFRRVPMYIFGESYGGKMAAEIGRQLDRRIKSGQLDISFKGVTLLDAWASPIDSILSWAPLLLNIGLIDEAGYERIKDSAEVIKETIDRGEFALATAMWGEQMKVVYEETDGVDFYNYLTRVSPYRMAADESPTERLYRAHVRRDEVEDIEVIMNGPVRDALNIPDDIVHGSQSGELFKALEVDFIKSVGSTVEDVLNNTNLEVVVWSGQLDLTVCTYGTLRWVNAMRWKDKPVWEAAPRLSLVMNDVVEGYYVLARNFKFYWINRAGHMVPKDNPEVALEILRRTVPLEVIG